MSVPYDPNNPYGDGFDAYGYDPSGFDRDGFNASGYDRYGFDRYGRDQLGRDGDGFYLDGYNEAGYDIDGYDRAGFNRYGYDRTGHDRTGNRSPTPSRPPTAREGGNGLIGGTVVTVAVTATVTALVVWLLRYLADRTPAAVWEHLASAPPVTPSPATAALTAAALAVVGIAAMVVMTVYTPGGAGMFRLLLALVGACLVIAMATNHDAATWLVSTVIVGVAGAAIAALAPTIGPRTSTATTGKELR